MLVDSMLPTAVPQASAPASLIGKWTYEGTTSDHLPFTGTAFITSDGGYLKMSGTRVMTTETAKGWGNPWYSNVVAISDQRLVMYYTITGDDGQQHGGLTLLNLSPEPITEMVGTVWRLAPEKLYGSIRLTKSSAKQ